MCSQGGTKLVLGYGQCVHHTVGFSVVLCVCAPLLISVDAPLRILQGKKIIIIIQIFIIIFFFANEVKTKTLEKETR